MLSSESFFRLKFYFIWNLVNFRTNKDDKSHGLDFIQVKKLKVKKILETIDSCFILVLFGFLLLLLLMEALGVEPWTLCM